MIKDNYLEFSLFFSHYSRKDIKYLFKRFDVFILE